MASCILGPPFGGLSVVYAVHLQHAENILADFLLMTIEFFSSSYSWGTWNLQYWVVSIFEEGQSLWAEIFYEDGPSNHCWYQKLEGIPLHMLSE